MCWPPHAASPSAGPRRMGSWQRRSGTHGPLARSATPWARTPSRSSSRATASFGPVARWEATPEASRGRSGCSRSRVSSCPSGGGCYPYAPVGTESPKDECGLFGVWAPGDDVGRLTYFGLFAQQHRGQESAGIAVSDGHNILVYKDLGLVSQVFNEATLTTLHGDLAVGHTRYSTTGSTTWENAQPVFKTDGVRSVALGHNGNLVNTRELATMVR